MIEDYLSVEEFDAYVEALPRLYIKHTKDRFKIPILVNEDIDELAKAANASTATIYSTISRIAKGKVRSTCFDKVDYWSQARSYPAGKMWEMLAEGADVEAVCRKYSITKKKMNEIFEKANLKKWEEQE